MLGVAMADVATKIACLEEVDADTLKACIEENEIKSEYAPYYVLVYYLIQSDVVDSYDNLVDYAQNIISKIETITGIHYDESFKGIVIDFFIAFRKLENFSVDERIMELESIVQKYKETTVGTIEWFLVEFIKRELLGRYANNIKYIGKMKSLIAETYPHNEEFKSFSSKL